MDPAEAEDGLFGTFMVITPNELTAELRQLQPLSLGRLWLRYEELIDEIHNNEYRLGHPQDYMGPEDYLKYMIGWDRARQLRPLYEELLVEKGWSGEGYPPRETLLFCERCVHRLTYRDRGTEVCDECEEDAWRD
jgi:hypothetical protein